MLTAGVFKGIKQGRHTLPPATKRNMPHHLVNSSILVSQASLNRHPQTSQDPGLRESRGNTGVLYCSTNSPMYCSVGARWSIQSVAHAGRKSRSVIRKVQCLHCYMYCVHVCVTVRAVLSDGPWHLGNAVMSYRPPVPYRGEEEEEWVRRREGC